VATFSRDFQLSTLDNLDLLDRPVIGASFRVLNLFDKIVALQDFAEDNMTTIKPTRNRENKLHPHDQIHFKDQGSRRPE
jgi:hypothetical protein